MKKLFRADVTIHATAYIVAENADEAKALIANIQNTAIEVGNGQVSEEITVTGQRFSPTMPQVSLSPAMSVGVVELEDEDGEAF